MGNLRIVLGAIVLLGAISTCIGAEEKPLQQENAQLRRRLERLENSIEEIRKAALAQSKPAAADAKAAGASASAAPNRDTEQLKQENAQLKQRIEKLEAALTELGKAKPPAAPASAEKARTSETKAAPTAEKARAADPKTLPAVAPAASPTKAAPATNPAPPVAPAPAEPPARKDVWSNLDIQLYGYIKGDASYDTSRTTAGNYVLYVDSEATRDNDDEFNLTANQTRMGFNITGPGSETMKTSGKVEFDFFGNYASENKAKIQMRHAYMTLLWPKADFSLIAGQTADVVSPLNPNTLNYTVLWNAGNTGYRRPQLRLTKGLSLDEKTSMKFEVAAARTIGRTDLTGSETGEDAGYPTVQGRVSIALPFVGPKPAVIGFSGLSGSEEYDLDATGRNTDFDSSMLCLDVALPLSKWLTLQGELFSGKNIEQYFGGIGQGVNTTALEEIDSQGGWIAASLGPWSQWSFNVGAGVDDVDADNVANGARTLNSSIFGNVIYSWNKHVQAGFELSQWNTHYRGPGDADDTRAQLSFIYTF